VLFESLNEIDVFAGCLDGVYLAELDELISLERM
jgi:hypothetical protein